jgi:acyl carrier protein
MTQSRTSQDLERWLTALVADLLKIPEEEIDVTARLDRYGLDSVAALSVMGALEQHLGRELDPALPYDFPTIRALARHLAGEP